MPKAPMPARSVLPPLIAAALVVLCCTACGRRGSLQPPGAALPASGTQGAIRARSLPASVGLGDAGVVAPDPDAVRDGDEVAASATPAARDSVPVQTTRGAKRGYVIPKDPFILDSIL